MTIRITLKSKTTFVTKVLDFLLEKKKQIVGLLIRIKNHRNMKFANVAKLSLFGAGAYLFVLVLSPSLFFTPKTLPPEPIVFKDSSVAESDSTVINENRFYIPKIGVDVALL